MMQQPVRVDAQFGSLSVQPESVTPYTDATHCRKTKKHIVRPMNAFIVWSQIERREITRVRPDIHNAEISKRLGERWRNLTTDQRQPYMDEAERLRVLHSREYPNYKYQPRKRPKPDQHGFNSHISISVTSSSSYKYPPAPNRPKANISSHRYSPAADTGLVSEEFCAGNKDEINEVTDDVFSAEFSVEVKASNNEEVTFTKCKETYVDSSVLPQTVDYCTNYKFGDNKTVDHYKNEAQGNNVVLSDLFVDCLTENIAADVSTDIQSDAISSTWCGRRIRNTLTTNQKHSPLRYKSGRRNTKKKAKDKKQKSKFSEKDTCNYFEVESCWQNKEHVTSPGGRMATLSSCDVRGENNDVIDLDSEEYFTPEVAEIIANDDWLESTLGPLLHATLLFPQ